MKLLRSLAVYVYLAGKVVYGTRYFKKLEAQKESLGDAVVAMKIRDYYHGMALKILKLTGGSYVVKGAENLPKEGTALYVANHQSYMDIPAVLGVLERPAGFVVKDDLEKIPFFDQWLTYLQCVPIARGEARKALEAILKAAKILKSGRDMVLFPEGTRSKDGTLLPFKAGSLKAAQRGNAMIVPLAIDGACDVMPRGSFVIQPKQITVTVFQPIPAETVKEMDTVDLALLVRNQIAGALNQPLLQKEAIAQNEDV